jgi:hypothetical protein
MVDSPVRFVGLATVLAVAGVLVSACSFASPPLDTPAIPTFTTSTTPPPVTRGKRPVPKTCAGVVSQQEVEIAVGKQLNGDAQEIVGVPEPSIGRTARLDCYYGIAGGKTRADASVMVGIATYKDDQSAQERLSSSVQAEQNSGAKATDVKVGPDSGVLLTGGDGNMFTLVVAHGPTSVVINAAHNLVSSSKMQAVLIKIADRALAPH